MNLQTDVRSLLGNNFHQALLDIGSLGMLQASALFFVAVQKKS